MPNSSGEWVTGDTLTAASLNTTDEVASTGATAEANWQVNDFNANRRGPFLQFTIEIEYTSGTALTVASADGEISNTQVATLPATCQGAETSLQPLTSGALGRVASGYYNASTGGVFLAAAAGAGHNIVSGDIITLGGVVVCD